jgi:hypothetical protein
MTVRLDDYVVEPSRAISRAVNLAAGDGTRVRTASS